MVEAVLRSRRCEANEKVALAAARYAALGWPAGLGARLSDEAHRRGAPGRACSCDRVGCPAPGAHPMSPAWQLQASTDPSVIARWWARLPQATILLATGRTFDVLDVPAPAATSALDRSRDSYVVAPPSRLCSGVTARWVIEPGAEQAADPLPDALRLIEYLADACEEIAP
jgi:hypothetical protein